MNTSYTNYSETTVISDYCEDQSLTSFDETFSIVRFPFTVFYIYIHIHLHIYTLHTHTSHVLKKYDFVKNKR